MSILHWSRKLFVLIAALAFAAGCATSKSQPDATMDTLVTAEWLSEHLDDPDLVVLDCSVSVKPGEDGVQIGSGRAEYEGGHIPSAGFADLLGDLVDGDSPLKFAVPTPEQFCAAMGALGVGDDSRVVLYDLGAWTAEGRPLSTEPANRTAKMLTPAPRPELIADRDEVLAAIDDSAVYLIDTLPEASYRGEMAMYGRPGHIPSASNTPFTALIDESGRYRPHDELAALFDGDRNARTITYCGGGIAASSSAFIMTRLGFTDVAVYTASLQEWATDSANPMVVDE
jgi:thiosulfate/3-mercaptopyruvate sulfurtransferase